MRGKAPTAGLAYRPRENVASSGTDASTVIVFGASGNTGEALASTLGNAGIRVVGVGRRSSALEGVPKATYVQADLTDARASLAALDSVLDDTPTAAINLASVQPSILPYDPNQALFREANDYFLNNIVTLSTAFEICRMFGVRQYIGFSTHREIELAWSREDSVSQDAPFSPNVHGDHALYAVTKVSSTLATEHFGKRLDMQTVVLRLPMIYLATETDTFLHRGVRRRMPYLQMIHDALVSLQLEAWGDQGIRRDYLHGADLCDLVLAILREMPERHATYNVGTGKPASTLDVANAISEVFTRGKATIKLRPEKSVYKCATYDIAPLEQQFAFSPRGIHSLFLTLKRDIIDNNLLDKWGWPSSAVARLQNH